MPPLANANKAPLIVLKTAASAAALPSIAAAATSSGTAATSGGAGSPIKRRKNPLSPLLLGSQCQSTIAPPQAIASPLLSGGSCSSSTTSPQSSPAVRTTKASRLRAAALGESPPPPNSLSSSPNWWRSSGFPSVQIHYHRSLTTVVFFLCAFMFSVNTKTFSCKQTSINKGLKSLHIFYNRFYI